VEEGAEPQAVDAALTDWGMALGPLATLGRIGNDLLAGVLARRAAARPGLRQPHLLAALVAAGRRRVSAGAGWYDYAPGSRQARRRRLAALSRAARAAADIVARCLAAVIAEGDLLLAEGMAREAGDIDAMFVAAYGAAKGATGGDASGRRRCKERHA
jgi:3-hydroxyacyl-CoA dehydrogenase